MYCKHCIFQLGMSLQIVAFCLIILYLIRNIPSFRTRFSLSSGKHSIIFLYEWTRDQTTRVDIGEYIYSIIIFTPNKFNHVHITTLRYSMDLQLVFIFKLLKLTFIYNVLYTCLLYIVDRTYMYIICVRHIIHNEVVMLIQFRFVFASTYCS